MTAQPPRRRLFNRAFVTLLVTQFLGVMNDNILKQVLMFMVASGGLWHHPLGRTGLGDGGQSIVGLCLTLPFIFLSGLAGQLCDRYSKRTVMMGVKLVELPICLIAAAGFYLGELWLAVGAMVLMGVHSAFFGPAKFGIVPEILDPRDLSRGNGLLNMLSNVAVIVGSMAAGPIASLYYDRGGAGVVKGPTVPGATMLTIALCGIVSICGMPRLPAAQPNLQFRWNPFASYITTISETAGGPLLTATLAWATFYMISMIALLIVPEYGDILKISYQSNAYLLGILGLTVALGSLICGYVSGDQIRPQLIPWGAGCMTVCLLLLGIVPPTYSSVCVLVAGVGLSAGFYVVPLQALMQHLSPPNERGRYMATANAISFVFVSAGSIIYWWATSVFRMAPNRVHLIAGGIALMGTLVGIIRLRALLAARNSANAAPIPTEDA